MNIDDWYGEISIGFCKGIATFDENKKIKLSTYVYLCMLNQLRMEKRKKHLNVCSLDEDLGDGAHRIECIASKNNEIEDWEFSEDFRSYYSKLSSRDKDIINRRLRGQTQAEISKELNISQPTVTRSLIKIKNSIEKGENK